MNRRSRLEVDLATFAHAVRGGADVIDVREHHEYAAGHVPGARLIPLGTLPARAHELSRGRPVYVICATGGRSLAAARALAGAGYEAYSVAGGTDAWAAAGHPVISGPRAA